MKKFGYVLAFMAIISMAVPVFADEMPKSNKIKTDNTELCKYKCTPSDLEYFKDQSRSQLAKGNTTEEIIGATLMGIITLGSVYLVVFNARRAAGL